MNKQGTFELYSPNKSVMVELFPCSGELQVIGTENYSDFQYYDSKKHFRPGQTQNEIELEENNYAGHYVISYEPIEGQYFIRVKGKSHIAPGATYMLNYYYYN